MKLPIALTNLLCLAEVFPSGVTLAKLSIIEGWCPVDAYLCRCPYHYHYAISDFYGAPNVRIGLLFLKGMSV